MTTDTPPETLTIDQAIARWEEIIDRTVAGETFLIAVDGVPKARLKAVSQQRVTSVGKPLDTPGEP